jgi:hypothetical protein
MTRDLIRIFCHWLVERAKFSSSTTKLYLEKLPEERVKEYFFSICATLCFTMDPGTIRSSILTMVLSWFEFTYLEARQGEFPWMVLLNPLDLILFQSCDPASLFHYNHENDFTMLLRLPFLDEIKSTRVGAPCSIINMFSALVIVLLRKYFVLLCRSPLVGPYPLICLIRLFGTRSRRVDAITY